MAASAATVPHAKALIVFFIKLLLVSCYSLQFLFVERAALNRPALAWGFDILTDSFVLSLGLSLLFWVVSLLFLWFQ